MISPRNRQQEWGFTLLELIVVIAVMGLVMGLVVARGPMRSRGLDLRAVATDIAGELRDAQSMAIAENRAVAFELDLQDKRYRVDHGPVHNLPESIGVTLMSTVGQVRGPKDGAIRFDSDGSSSGGRIDLIDGRRHIQIGVDWLSGRVSIADAS